MLRLTSLVLFMLCAAQGLSAQTIPQATPGDSRAVVFDIDGTLTPNVYAIWIARQDAATTVTQYADAGYRIIYLSARVGLFQSGVPDWLIRRDFPSGHIHMAQTQQDHDDPAAFKLGILRAYQAQGWELVAAYGDSSTDFAAYAGAGIPADHVFALRRSGRRHCKTGVWQGCYRHWAELRPSVNALTRDARQ